MRKENVDLKSHPWPHIKNFYDPVTEKVFDYFNNDRPIYKGSLKCTRCSAKIRFSTKSTYTLKNHYKKVSSQAVVMLFGINATQNDLKYV